MDRRSDSWRLMAIIAAYAFALRTLLLPFSIAAGGNVTGSSTAVPICSSASIAGSSDTTPQGHNSECSCAAGCGTLCYGHVLTAPPQDVALTIHIAGEMLAAFHGHVDGTIALLPLRVCAPRGPPSA